MRELWQAFKLSIEIASSATVLGIVVGVPIALFMSRVRFTGKSVVEGLIILPMVMPPTVMGYAILIALGRGGPLYYFSGYTITFRFEGAVLAAMLVALPLLYLPAKAGFAAVDRDQEDNARLMGANRWQMFWHISLPLASRGLYSGILLAFARALGEFGATVMVFGWQSSHQTLPIRIYADWENGELAHSTGAVITLTAISMALTIAYNRSGFAMQE